MSTNGRADLKEEIVEDSVTQGTASQLVPTE